MVRKLVIPLFIVALAASSTQVQAVSLQQSAHFKAAGTAANTGPGALGSVGVQCTGLGSWGSGPIDLVNGDSTLAIADRATKATCIAAFNKFGTACTGGAPVAATCVAGATSCCDVFDPASGVCIGGTAPPGTVCTIGGTPCPGGGTCTQDAVATTINCAGGGKLYAIQRLAGLANDGFEVTVVAGAGASVNNFAINGNLYNALDWDAAAKALIQIRPNGATGNVTIRITHNTGVPPNPRVATLVVTGSNNDPSEAATLHNDLNTALASTGLGITTINHPLVDAKAPLTAFGFLKQATNFSEISNITPAQITHIEFAAPAGMQVSIEGSENSAAGLADAGAVPTLNTWGIVVLMAMLLLAGYVLMRRQRAAAATV